MELSKYKKIIIVGNCGSGKSHLSKRIAELTGLPLIHLDVEFWKPNWEMTPREEWIRKQSEMIAKDRWIIDGNYNSTMELRFTAADLIIFLDINRFVCLFSAIKRHGKKRSDLPEYLEEKLDFEFLEFCKLILNFSKRGKAPIMELHLKYPEKDFIRIKDRRKMKQMFLE